MSKGNILCLKSTFNNARFVDDPYLAFEMSQKLNPQRYG